MGLRGLDYTNRLGVTSLPGRQLWTGSSEPLADADRSWTPGLEGDYLVYVYAFTYSSP